MIEAEKVFLFDMDGTLTPPRGAITPSVIRALRKLSENYRIGIITGSDMDYIRQQAFEMFGVGGVPVDRVDLLPCNGTKKYVANKSRRFIVEHEADMLAEIGSEAYFSILRFCMQKQIEMMDYEPQLPYGGTFFQYRGSLLNWCQIGRSVGMEERSALEAIDLEKQYRKRYADQLALHLAGKNIPVTVALGGSTSLDIYPNGWDKTYGLQHYPDCTVYFAGDRCDPGGNDWHIYEKLKPFGRSFKVTSPEDTVRLIEQFINS